MAMFTSNCHNAGATERLNYLTELMRYIGVHSYGKCLNNRQEPSMPDDPGWPSLAQRRARKVKVLSHYKFYLAFENLGIEDYVSEKVFIIHFLFLANLFCFFFYFILFLKKITAPF